MSTKGLTIGHFALNSYWQTSAFLSSICETRQYEKRDKEMLVISYLKNL